MTAVRIGLLGYGFGGRYFHAPLLAAAADCDFLGVVTSSEARRAQVADELPGCEVYSDLEELAAAGAEAVAISTPAETHMPLAQQALRLGLAVVCDKPFALDGASARRTVELSEKLGLPLSVYQNRRWDADFLTVRSLLEAGSLGDIVRFESRFERYQPEPGPPAAGGGTLLDFGSHLLDQALVLFGPVASVYAELRSAKPGGLDDDIFVALTHRSGVRSHLSGSWVQGAPEQRFRLSGTAGSYRVDGVDGQEDLLLAGRSPAGEGERWASNRRAAAVRSGAARRPRRYHCGVAGGTCSIPPSPRPFAGTAGCRSIRTRQSPPPTCSTPPGAAPTPVPASPSTPATSIPSEESAMTDTSNDPVLQPLTINGLTLRNRIYSTGHAPAGYLEAGEPGLRYELYHEEKAKGGLALSIIGGSSNVAADSASVFDQINAAQETVLPFYRSISQRMHRHGAAVMIQLTHLGRRSQWDIDRWLPAVSPSGVRERAHRSFPKPIERLDIDRIVRAYGDAARLAREGGLDGVEIAAMAGHLIDQFWSPRTNQRTDEFGGSLENRLRFGQLVLTEIRRQVGPDFVVGMRIPGDEGARNGLGQSDCIDIATATAATGLVDFFSVVYGSGNTDRELSDLIPVFGRPLGGSLSVAGAIGKEVELPILHAGRIADLSTARHALRGGYADMVGMTRAHIADPYIVAKLLAGEEDRIRPCVGATYCASRVETFCLHNPATGREATIAHTAPPADQPLRVVVVGGGPAGLEAARVSAERGHQVTLLEAADKLGGQVLLAARTQRHAEKLGIAEWLAGEVRRLGVTVRLNCYAEKQDVLALAPEVVIVATGGYPDTGVVDDGEELLTSTWDVLSQTPTAGRTALVYDDHGGEQALTAAERLATAGVAVELVTPDRMIGAQVTGTIYPDYLRVLYSKGVVATPDHELRSVRRGNGNLVATLVNAYTDAEVRRCVDQVVVEHGTIAVDELYSELRAGSVNLGETDPDRLVAVRPQDQAHNPAGRYRLFRIGDAVAHRNVHAAIYDARRLCLAL